MKRPLNWYLQMHLLTVFVPTFLCMGGGWKLLSGQIWVPTEQLQSGLRVSLTGVLSGYDEKSEDLEMSQCLWDLEYQQLVSYSGVFYVLTFLQNILYPVHWMRGADLCTSWTSRCSEGPWRRRMCSPLPWLGRSMEISLVQVPQQELARSGWRSWQDTRTQPAELSTHREQILERCLTKP